MVSVRLRFRQCRGSCRFCRGTSRPSAIAIVGDTILPTTVPLGLISTFLLALILPSTLPSTTTSLARISALAVAFGPIVTE